PEAFSTGRRKSPFPKNAPEALALSAIELAGQGMTMVFVAKKSSAEPFGKTILDCVNRRHGLAAAAGGAFSLPADIRVREEIARCLRLIQEHVGADSIVGKCLEAGVVVHHGGLPQVVRLGLERLVRGGAVRLVVATTTLAQGVNFPIRTVLVHSLDHGQ